MKRFRKLCISALLLGLAAGCGGPEQTAAPPDHSAQVQTTVSESPGWTGEGGPYAWEEIGAPDGCLAAYACDNTLFYAVYTAGATPAYNIMVGDKTVYSTDNMLCAAISGSGGLWLLEADACLRFITASGEIQREISCPWIENPSQVYLRSGGDRLYVIEGQQITMLNHDGAVYQSCLLPDAAKAWAVSDTGQLYVLQTAEGKDMLRKVDPDTGKSEKLLEADGGAVHSGQNGYFLLLSDGTGLYEISEDGGLTPIVLWEECHIPAPELQTITPMADGQFFLRSRSGLYLLKPADPADITPKKKLVIASLTPESTIQDSAARFSQYSGENYIQVVDYTQGGALPADQAILRLHADLVSGSGPDMLLFTPDFTPYPYIRQDYLVDMLDLFGTDGAVSIEDIAVARALEVSGGIYFVGSRFYAETILGLKSTFGDAFGWTLDTYLELESARPAGAETLYNTTRERFLREIAARYIRTAIDWETGDCNFDCPEFIEILRASARVRENPEGTNAGEMDFTYGPVRVAKGTLLGASSWIDSVWKLAFEEYAAGCELSAIGWPTADGSCGSDVYVIDPIGICSQGENIDACWAFVQFYLQDIQPDTSGLPMYMPLLEQELQNAQQKVEGQFQITREDAEAFLTFLSQIENVVLYDETVLNIIETECAAFFAGDKSAEETARLIQSKVSLYVAEQG